MEYIYAIKNIVNNKIYIGSTKSLKTRKYHHFYELKKNIHGNIHLQCSYNEHGKDKFYFYLIEECDKSIRQEREIYWINHFNSHLSEFGYNMYQPNGNNNFTCSKETQQKLMELKRDFCQGIDAYTIDLEFLGTFPSINDCSRYYNIPDTIISQISNRQNNRLSYKGLTFFKKDEIPYKRKSSKQRNMAKFYKTN